MLYQRTCSKGGAFPSIEVHRYVRRYEMTESALAADSAILKGPENLPNRQVRTFTEQSNRQPSSMVIIPTKGAKEWLGFHPWAFCSQELRGREELQRRRMAPAMSSIQAIARAVCSRARLASVRNLLHSVSAFFLPCARLFLLCSFRKEDPTLFPELRLQNAFSFLCWV
jgi:hypothetical protein